MQAVVATLTMVQRQVGGGIIFLKCEDHEKLLAFYQNEQNCYKRYGFRKSDKDAKTYVRLLRFFDRQRVPAVGCAFFCER